MANSRYDNIRVFDGSNFIIPSQIKVFNGTSWVDYGTKNSTNNKKFNAFNGSNFACYSYARRDVNIPAYIQIGNGGKYLDMYDWDYTNQQVDTYNRNYSWEMQVEVYSTTPLYTVHTKNNGDIYAAAYTNVFAEVFNGNQVRIIMGSRWRGITIGTRYNINQPYSQRSTGFMCYVGEKVMFRITRSGTTGAFYITCTRPDGSVNSGSISVSTQWVGNPNGHRIGASTNDDYGNISVYGNAKLYYFSHTKNSSRTIFNFATSNYGNGTGRVGNGNGFADCRNTSVTVANYSVYDRQSV